MEQSYLNIFIQNKEVIIRPVNEADTEDILENNIGNVRDFLFHLKTD
jgi:hypothetical protein